MKATALVLIGLGVGLLVTSTFVSYDFWFAMAGLTTAAAGALLLLSGK